MSRPLAHLVLLAFAVGPATANADASALAERIRWLHHRAPYAGLGGPSTGDRHKPDDVGAFDVVRVRADLDAAADRLPGVGRFEVTLAAVEGDRVGVSLLALDWSPIEILDRDGEPLDFVHDREFAEVVVLLPEPSRIGDEVFLSIEADIDRDCADPIGCIDNATLRHRVDIGWFPTSYAFPTSDRFEFELVFTVDRDDVVAAPGQPLDVDPVAGAARYRFASARRSVLLAFAMGPYAIETLDAEVPVTSYASDRAFDGGATMRSLVADAISSHADVVGAFPFSGLSVVAIDDRTAAGLGPQMLALIPEALWTVGAGQEDFELIARVVSHEVGHQWFYNTVAVDGGENAWLSEAFAEYLATRDSTRRTGYLAHARENYWGYVLRVERPEDRAIADPEIVSSPRYVEIVYLKGSTVLHMLAARLGRETFDEVMHAYVDAFTDQLTTNDELQRFFEAQSQRPLDDFFDQWVRRPGFPSLTIRVQPARNDDDPVTFALDQVGPSAEPPFGGPLPLRLHEADNRVRDVDVRLEPGDYQLVGGQTQWLEFDPDFTVLRHLRPEPTADVNLSGVVDGMDLIDIHHALGRGAPDVDWDLRLDPTGDFVVDERDVRHVVESFGEGW